MPAPDFLCAWTGGPEATKSLAAAVAELVADGDLLVLTGDLGAGKTCFTQGLGAGLGVVERITSPTFTLAAVYDGRLRLNHLDVYRLDDLAETLDLDLPELLEDGVTVIEWGERIGAVLPGDRLVVDLRYLEPEPGRGPDDDLDRRSVRFDLRGTWRARRGPLAKAIEPWSTPC